MSWLTNLISKLNFNGSEQIDVTILNLYQIIFLRREIHRLTVRNWEGKKLQTILFPGKTQSKKHSVKQIFCTFYMNNCKCNSLKLKAIHQ